MKLYRSLFYSRGLSLLESALALAVFGLVIAGIWVLSGGAFGSSKKNQLAQQVVATVEGVRDYIRQADIGNAILQNNALMGIGALPADVRRGGSFGNAYGGSFNVFASKVSIGITLTRIPSDACVDLIYARLGGGPQVNENFGFAGYAQGSFSSLSDMASDFSFQSITDFCRTNDNGTISVGFLPS